MKQMIDTSGKILVFTDIHFGIHSNSSSYMEICRETMSWIREFSLKSGIRNILFLGDYFDSRANIDIKTLNVATESLYSIADSGINISLILGNHDIYLRDSTSIHSLFAFNGHDGISIIDKPIVLGNVAFLPWQFGTSGTEKIQNADSLKYVFCHHNFPVDFFFNGKSRKKTKSDTFVRKNRYEEAFGIQNDIVEGVIGNNGLIFSGHIHNRKEIPIGDGGKSKIIICGSPYETSWGFNGVDCGAYVVDMSSSEFEFVSNPFNKKHIEIRTSSAESDFDSVNFKNSIVRLTVDTQESFDTISKLQSRIRTSEPFAVENTKYEFTVAEFVGKNSNALSENGLCENANNVSSKLDYVRNSIDNYDFSAFSYMRGGKSVGIDRDRLKDIATKLFEGGL